MGGGKAQVLVDSNGEWVFNVGPYSGITIMEDMFYNCSSLTSLDLSGLNTSKVTSMEYMFSGCTNLKTITMKGCSKATINKIKAQLATDGITSCTIVTE